MIDAGTLVSFAVGVADELGSTQNDVLVDTVPTA